MSLSVALLSLRVSTSRQAHKGGESEGYSIPAQRSACMAKAAALGAVVEGEFVDAGASARSADREGLQALLARLSDKTLPCVPFVIVHKLDRLARDRADDVALLMAIRSAGAQLVSVSEQIDETPSGMLLHGIMATIAEFYSRNLSAEAKKGIAEKARRGGTIGYAPTGYLNSTRRLSIDGAPAREVKTVIFDPDRAPHVAWAFTTYAGGNVSLSDLCVQLAARGLTSRDSRSSGGPITRAHLHRMLSNPYYMGKISHRGVLYDGQHEPLVTPDVFQQVQDVLAGRRIGGDRSWKRTHFLKGTVYCQRCHSRLGFSRARGRGGEYDYFYCLGRAKKRTDCELPYLPAHAVEASVERYWSTKSLSPSTATAVRHAIEHDLTTMRTSRSRELRSAQTQVTRLTKAKQRLLDAYLAEALTVTDFKTKQTEIGTELTAAQSRLDALQQDDDRLLVHVDLVLSVLQQIVTLYRACPDDAKQLINQALARKLYLDTTGVSDADFDDSVATVLDLADDTDPGIQDTHGNRTAQNHPDTTLDHPGRPQARQDSTPTPHTPTTKNPARSLRTERGSYVAHLAEAEGFEPSMGATPNRISSAAP